MATEKNIRIKQKVDTLKNWTTNNPILLKNEVGYEIETEKFKIGDGVTHWSDLKTEENSKGFKILSISTVNSTSINLNIDDPNSIAYNNLHPQDEIYIKIYTPLQCRVAGIVGHNDNITSIRINGNYILDSTEDDLE